jgi:simple sugar transport system permease protein
MDGVVLLSMIVAAAPPLLFAVLGETLCERAGVINLGLDGMLVLSAMTGFAAACATNSLVIGFMAGALTGVLVALVLALATLTLRQSQFAVGFVLTLLCRDLAYALGTGFENRMGPQVASCQVPGLAKVPFFGPVFFAQDPVVYASLFSIVAAWFFLYHTQAGLKVRGLGENPQACFARGVNVVGQRYVYLVAGGALVGLGGAAFSLCIKGWSRPDGISGTGWIALAIVIFGGWHPVRAALGAYLFVALQFAAVRWQNSLPPEIPSQLLTCLPFPMMIFALLLVTLVSAERTQRVLARLPEGPRKLLEGVLGLLKASPPAALGQDFKPD